MNCTHGVRLAGLLAVAIAGLAVTGCSAGKLEQIKEEATGIWRVVESNGSDLTENESMGWYSFYEFKDDGVFVMKSHLLGSTVERDGTWRVEDGQVLIDVPEAEEQSGDGPITSLSADAIEDAAVEIEEDELTATLPTGDVKAEKVSKDEYDELMEAAKKQAAEAAPKEISIGKEVESEACTFTVNSLDFAEMIYPDDTSGYYSYYEARPGNVYLAARVTFKNNNTEYASPGWSTKAYYMLDGNKYQAQLDVIDGSNLSQSYSIDPQQVANAVIFAEIPESMKDASSVKLVWNIPKQASYMNKYFSDSVQANSYELLK